MGQGGTNTAEHDGGEDELKMPNLGSWVKHSVPPIQSFLIDCRKTWAQVFSMAHQKERKYLNSRWKLKEKTTKLPKARENAGDKVVIGFSFASDWRRVVWVF